MGNCMHRSRHVDTYVPRYTTNVNTSNAILSDAELNVPLGRNKRIKVDKLKWKSEALFSEGELISKRKEFWDTAPVFGGRIEMWDALKAALDAIQNENTSLAQSIIDCAQIILPNGDISDCYDQLGNRYQIPNYVINKPVNLQHTIVATSSNRSSEASSKSSTRSDLGKVKKITKKAKKVSSKKQFPLRFRLSTHTQTNLCELKIMASPHDRIYQMKRLIFQLKQIEPCKQTMYFGGKCLNDKQVLKSIKLKKNFVVQVMCKE